MTAAEAAHTKPVLSLRGLTVRFGSGRTAMTAVDGVDLDVGGGQVLGLVGESGSGKSTVAKAVVGLVPTAAGSILVDGRDVTRARGREATRLRRRVGLVFQDPYASLDPRMTIGASVAEGLPGGVRRSRADRDRAVGDLLTQVALDRDAASARPGQLSGGQRQRVVLARALAAQPSVLIADEITSALDVSVQGAVLNLVRELQQQLGFSLVFISHNLAVVRYLADTIAVMYAGRIVETAAAERLIDDPQHPYTRTLLAAVPRLGVLPDETGEDVVGDDPPDPHALPHGCRFHPRCPEGPLVLPRREVCRTADPSDDAGARAHRAACLFAPSAHLEVASRLVRATTEPPATT